MMPMFMVSYDLRKQRNYQPLYDILIKWKAVRALESLWLAELKGNAAEIRDVLMGAADAMMESCPRTDSRL